jgi:hypothetical protein
MVGCERDLQCDPQVAGMVALLLQHNGAMTPAEVKAALEEMAVGVTQGRSGNSHNYFMATAFGVAAG